VEHLEIIANCKGDGITAITSCLKLVKCHQKDIDLNFPEGFSIRVRPTSDAQDLIQIMMLERQAIKNKKK
jgi:hypothetical protein